MAALIPDPIIIPSIRDDRYQGMTVQAIRSAFSAFRSNPKSNGDNINPRMTLAEKSAGQPKRIPRARNLVRSLGRALQFYCAPSLD